jgi:transporter family-2 protein
MLTGGALGAAIVFSITISGPKIGTTAVVGLLIAGQLVAATVIDRYGWFGFDRVALDWPRVLGIALLAAGAALTLRR